MIKEITNVRVRGASIKDYTHIERLYKNANFKVDYKHLEHVMVVEDENGIIAIGSLNTILEASFLTESSRSQRSRVIALVALMDFVDTSVRNLNYDSFHVFATNDTILKILKGKFKFVKTAAKQVLLRWVNK